MMTLNQLQAFYWVGHLGTLNRAADKLFVTQSAITKRLQEVEALASAPLFAKAGRKNVLTPYGKELLAECEVILKSVEALDALKKSKGQRARTLHVGLTELTAVTWFAAFLKRMRQVYPMVTVEPEIDLSQQLCRKVEDGKLDLALVPEPSVTDGLAKVALGQAQFGWFAARGIFRPGKTYALPDLAKQPVIEQSDRSVITALCARLWESAGVQPQRIYGGNNVLALAGLISVGVGISCLPVALFKKEVRGGKLQLIRTSPSAPSVEYCCAFLKHPHSALGYGIANIARESCDFGHTS